MQRDTRKKRLPIATPPAEPERGRVGGVRGYPRLDTVSSWEEAGSVISDRVRPEWLALAAAVLALAAVALFASQRDGEAAGSEAKQAFDTLSESEIMVNSDYELEEQEPLPDGLGGRVGKIEASYDGPDDFDVVQIDVFESEGDAEQRWEDVLDKGAESQVALSTRQPRFASQICTLQNQTVKCSVRMYEAVITGMAGVTGSGFAEESAKANAQGLLMAGVKNWLDARGLGLPVEEEM